MSYNGSGTFLINTAGQPVVSGTVISSTAFNALTADLATGLSTAITKDGQTTVTANIPMGTYKFTGLGAGTAATDSANLSQVQSTVTKLLASVSGADTITAVGSPTLGAYAAGQMFYFIAAGDNTGAVTLNIDSLGAKSVTRDGTTALAAGDIQSGEVCVVVYDGTRFQLVNGASQSASIVTENLTVNKATVLNESGGDNDTRIEGDTDANLVFVDASTDRVGIGTNSPSELFTVSKNQNATTRLLVSNTDTTNTSSRGSVRATGGTVSAEMVAISGLSAFIGTSSNHNLELMTNGNGRAIIDTSGNLGLGVTPSGNYTLQSQINYNSGFKGFNLGGVSGGTSANGYPAIGYNTRFTSTGDSYVYNDADFANLIAFKNGQFQFLNAPSGTAGNAITFTQAMTLDASGILSLGVSGARLSFTGTSGDKRIGQGDALVTGGGSTDFAMQATNAILFATGGTTERARITSGGLLLVKRTTALDSGQIGLDFDGISNNGIAINDTASANGSGLIRFLTGGTVRGSITNDNNTGVLYNQTSDERLKKNIANADDFGDVIDAIQVRKFDWKENDSHTRAGFVAQELVTVAPEAVYQPNNEEDMMGVDYSKLVPMLVKEVQSLRKRVAELETK